MHELYMQKCLRLARKGLGSVAPNPMVGCVIVHNNKIIGQGYHKKFGQAHAEVNAIKSVKNKLLLKKSTLYVNLEPCSHHGKTPPCTDLIIHHHIPCVVIGTADTNHFVKGKGIKKIIKKGVDIKTGILEKECREINKRFFSFHEKKRPYILLKWAQTGDGFIAKAGQTKIEWISSAASQKLAHQWRSEEQAVMAGTNTALIDNPQLTVRHRKGKNPLRIVMDRNLRIPQSHHLLDSSTPTIVFNAQKTSKKNLTEYIKINFERNTEEEILNKLFKKNIQSVIIEGGALLINSFINKGLWDEAKVFTSNKKFNSGTAAPAMPVNAVKKSKKYIEEDTLITWVNRN